MSSSPVLVVRSGTAETPVLEMARLVRSDRGLRLEGHLVHAAGHGVHYSALVDPAGLLRRLTVRSDGRTAERTLRLTRAPGGPWVADRPDGQQSEPQLSGIDDITLEGSVVSLAVPLLRLVPAADPAGAEVDVELAVAALPGLELARRTVTYRISAVGSSDGEGAAGDGTEGEGGGRTVQITAGGTDGGSGTDVTIEVRADGFPTRADTAAPR